jgi:hypothetical protein
MARAKKQPGEKRPLDEQGLDPEVRGRILTYGAPDRRKQTTQAEPAKRRRRDDPSDGAPSP